MKSVYFLPKQTRLLAEAEEVIRKNAEIIRSNPGIEFIIEANTEREGLVEENEKKAKQRAEVVRDYLLSLGVKYDREVSVHTDIYPGFADKEPESRVIFKITKTGNELENKNPEEEKISEEKPPSRLGFEISGQAFYSRIDSTDFSTAGSSALVSNLNYRASLSVSYLLNEHWGAALFGSFKSESYVAPSNKTISNNSFIGRGFGVALKTKPTEKTTFLIMGNIEQNPFVRATSSTNLVFDLPYIFKISLGMDHDIAEGKTGIVGAGIRVSTLFRNIQPTYSIDQGSSFRGSIYTRNVFGLPINANFSYNWQIENTTIATQIEQSLIFQLGWVL